MTIWMDLTNSLTQHKGNIVGIVRAELLEAKYLHELDSSIKFSVLTKFGFHEVPEKELKWLFNSENVGMDYLKFQKKQKNFLNRIINKIGHIIEKRNFKNKRRHRSPGILKKEFIVFPYKDGDVIYSCGWLGTNKETYFERVKSLLPELKLVYTIYDLVLVKEDIRHLYSPADCWFDTYLEWISDNCDAVIYGGHTAQIDAKNYFKEKKLHIPEGHWVFWGADIKTKYLPNDDNLVLEKLGLKKPYVLSVGSFDHKKNYRLLYQSFCLMAEKNPQNMPTLVIVGRMLTDNELAEEMLNNPRVKDKIKILSCSDKKLDVLYRNCEFALLPTLYEGWSLTLPESLNYGKLCLCSDVAPLREVGQDFVEYLNPHHPKEWAEKIISLITDAKNLKQKEDYIKKNWQTPTWKDSAKELYKYLSSIAQKIEKIDEILPEAEEILADTNTPKVYYDLSLIFYKGGLSGVPRTEMLLARYLPRLRQDIIFFTMRDGKYIEISAQKLSHLLSDEKLDKSVDEDSLDLYSLPTQEMPFKKNDVVFSVGCGFDNKSFNALCQAHREVGFTYCQVLYDLTPITVPHTHPQERVRDYPNFLKSVFYLSDFIFYGGKTAQEDSRKYQQSLGLSPVRSQAVKWGSDIVSAKGDSAFKNEVFAKYGITGDYLLTVGTLEARKNQQVLYEAYLELLRTTKSDALPQLVICGHAGWKTAAFANILNTDSRIKNKVIHITPKDDELDVLYRNCKFTMLASFYEGWSLTLPESLNYGKFCLTSDTPSLTETGEDIVDYANPYDPVEWAEKIRYYLDHPEQLKKREALIKEKWHNTTWFECAQNISKTLDMLLKEKK